MVRGKEVSIGFLLWGNSSIVDHTGLAKAAMYLLQVIIF
jgi:hypothetical protein